MDKTGPPAFQVMCKPRGAECNLDCSYCFYLEKLDLYPESDLRMSYEVLESFTRQYIGAQWVPEVVFSWQGGEPLLMGLEFFQNAVDLQAQYRRPQTKIQNTIQTNGTLIDDAWADFFRKNKFLVGISLDGPQDLHDLYRVGKGNDPTFQRVMQGLSVLQAHDVEYNILACVSAANANHPLPVYRFFRDEVGAKYIQFIPVVEQKKESNKIDGIQVHPRSVTSKEYGDFLIEIFDEWVKNDVGRVFVQIFDVALGVWFGGPSSLCVFSETCGAALALEHNGDLYSCDHFVDPTHLLGNIMDEDISVSVGGGFQTRFGKDKRDKLPQYCIACPVFFVCRGGCPKNRICHSPNDEPGLNYLCEGYRSFFSHIEPAMIRMVELIRKNRAPAEIMQDDLG